MSRTNRLGAISLLAASGGFLALQGLRRFHQLPAHAGWSVLQAGFEAGMVGGLADWFAVSALFRPIPSRRFRLPHTDLLVEKRTTLSAGIVDMVQNRWLSPETLSEHLQRMSASHLLLQHLAAPGARAHVVAAARDLLGRLTGSLNAPDLAAFLDRALRDQIADLDLGPLFGTWLEARVEGGDLAPLWDFLAATLAGAAERGEFAQTLQGLLETTAHHYKDRGLFQQVMGSLAELAFDYRQLAESIATAAARDLRALQADCRHPLRAQLDQQVLAFARRLGQHDPEACASLERLKRRLVEQAELEPVLTHLLGRLQESLRTELEQAGSPLDRILGNLLDSLLGELAADRDAQARLDGWVRRTVLDLAGRNHGVIGDMVAGSLAKLSDGELVRQIEAKIGPDLQYIRLNGAVVGGLVGVALAVLKILLGG